MTPFRRRILAVGIGCLASLALVVALEGVLRGLGRLRDGEWPKTQAVTFYGQITEGLRLYQPHPYLNTAPAAGALVQAFGKKASFNASGYRSPERPVTKDPCAVRILVAGGSTTFDLLAPTDAESWPMKLEGRLREKVPGVEVWNAGFPGWTTLENSISLLLRDGDLQPDLILLYQGINDLQPASLRPFDRQYRTHAQLARTAAGFDLEPPSWVDRSVLVESLRSGFGATRDPWQQVNSNFEGQRTPRLVDEGLETFERNVRSFVTLGRGLGSEVVLMTQPLRIRDEAHQADTDYLQGWIPGLDPEEAGAELERLNGVLRRVGLEKKLEVIDVAGLDWQDSDFGDPMHLLPSGSERLVKHIASRLPIDWLAEQPSAECPPTE